MDTFQSCVNLKFSENQTCTELRATIFRVTFCPQFPGGGKQWIHSGDPVDLAGLPTEKGGFPLRQKGHFPLWRRGGRWRVALVALWPAILRFAAAWRP